jgi:hypothetical protein
VGALKPAGKKKKKYHLATMLLWLHVRRPVPLRSGIAQRSHGEENGKIYHLSD